MRGRLEILIGVLAGAAIAYGLSTLVMGDYWAKVYHFSRNGGLFLDFRDYYYPQALGFWSGNPKILFGYVYTPIFAFMIFPLLWLSVLPAAAAWTTLSLLALTLTTIDAVDRRGLTPAGSVGVVTLATLMTLTSFPVFDEVKSAQVSAFAAAGVWWTLTGRSYRLARALVFGLVIAIKIYPIVFGAWFVARRDWRTVVDVALGTLFWVALPAAWFGIAATVGQYADILRQLDAVHSGSVFVPTSMYVPNVVIRFCYWVDILLNGGVAAVGEVAAVWQIASAVIGGGLLIWASFLWRRFATDPALAFVVVCATLPFLAPPMWSHYLVFLPVCLAVAWNRAVRHAPGPGRAIRLGWLGAATVGQSVLVFGFWNDLDAYGFLALPLVATWIAAGVVCATAPGPDST